MATIREFIEEFKEKKVINTHIAQNAVGEYIKKTLEVKDYLPFIEKRELCTRVLNACNTKDENGLVKVDSVSRYFIFTVSILSAYTNLEFSSGEDAELDALDEYDLLCQNDLLNPILDVIGEEYTTCNNILNMMMSDIVANNNTVENVLGSAAGKLTQTVDNLSSVLAQKVESMEFDLSQIDISKYEGLLNMLPNK